MYLLVTRQLELLRLPWTPNWVELCRKCMPWNRSLTRLATNIMSNLMSTFSMMSSKAPLEQKSVRSMTMWVSTWAPMKLLILVCLISLINFISFIMSRVISFFLSKRSSLILTRAPLYLAIWHCTLWKPLSPLIALAKLSLEGQAWSPL